MTNFLEKLKKGMGKTNSFQEKDEEIKNTNTEETAAAKKTEKKKRERIVKETKSKKTLQKKMASPKKIKKEKVETKEFLPKEDSKISFSAPIEEDKQSPVFSRIPVAKEGNWFEQEGQLTVDVYQTDKEVVVRSAIAGIKPEDLDISVENEVLLIKGKREEYKEENIKDYYYQECYWGKFSREIVLPEQVDASKINAALKDGILTIRIPKIKRGEKISISEE